MSYHAKKTFLLLITVGHFLRRFLFTHYHCWEHKFTLSVKFWFQISKWIIPQWSYHTLSITFLSWGSALVISYRDSSLSFHCILCWTMSSSSSSSSSSSCHAVSMDIPDPLLPFLPIIHCLWQVFRATSRILTYQLNVCSSWSSCFILWRSIGVHHLWACPCFSSCVLHAWFI